MAFRPSSLSLASTGAFAVWSYRTPDALSAVRDAGYFPASQFKRGDRIQVFAEPQDGPAEAADLVYLGEGRAIVLARCAEKSKPV